MLGEGERGRETKRRGRGSIIPKDRTVQALKKAAAPVSDPGHASNASLLESDYS